MTDRGRTSMAGSPACPFIAYEGERDERSAEPDHAHRCYAEVRPSARALAHQEAYCLSSAFPVCPTFQAWARREAAQARSAADTSSAGGSSAGAPTGAAASSAGAPTGAAASSAGAPTGAADPGPDGEPQPWADEVGDEPADPPLDSDELPVSRNPPRDWAAPPPWAPGAAAVAAVAAVAASRSVSSGDPPDFLASRSSEGRGLAGSAADRLAGGPPPADVRQPAVPSSAPFAPADPELAGLVGGSMWNPGSEVEPLPPVPPTRPTKRPAVSSTRDQKTDRTPDPTPVQAGPAWEKARRYEAYPTIKTRTGMPDIPRVVLLAGALGIAALALFFLPALLGIGGKDTGVPGAPGASPSPSVAVETASPSPTTPPAPTPQVYVVKEGDRLSRIATSFGLTLDQILAANPAIKDPNKIAIGDEIIIPAPPSDVVTDPSAEPSP